MILCFFNKRLGFHTRHFCAKLSGMESRPTKLSLP